MAQISYLALGDSYTIGTSVDSQGQWPRQLLKILSERGVLAGQSASHQLDIIATDGWTTGDLLHGIQARTDLREKYDLVSLLIGVNNQYQGRPLAEYRNQFRRLLHIAIERAGRQRDRVFVVSIPDYGYTPFGKQRTGVSQGVDRFNAVAKEITEAAGILFLNVTPISRCTEDEPQLVAEDNLHPSAEQYRRWVEEVLADAVAEILEQGSQTGSSASSLG